MACKEGPVEATDLDRGDWSDSEEEIDPNQIESVGQVKTSQFDYIQEHLEAEKMMIFRMKQSNEKIDGRVLSKDQLQPEEFLGGGCRGRGRGRGANFRRPLAGIGNSARFERQIYGKTPDVYEGDTDVYRKYSFKEKMHDTGNLAIFKMKDRILSTIKNHQIVTIEGFTGCGKTTQVPQFVLDEAVKENVPCKIVVTQPRRIAAISVANRVAAERNWPTGSIIGYQVGMDKRISEDTRLFYMTTGVLLQLLIGRKSLGEWTHIIIDEVHERDLETDLLLLVIKKLMVDTCNDRVRIIMMSATLNAVKFATYYPSWCSSDDMAANVKIDVETMYPIEEFYLEEAVTKTAFEPFELRCDEPKLYPEAVELAVRIIESFDEEEKYGLRKRAANRGAVLVFLPGLLEIETMAKALAEAGGAASEMDRSWNVLPLHSSITNDEQQRVFHPSRDGSRKIILATNIAESSITVPDILYVIDFCLTKNLSCDVATNYTCLRLDWASKNECIQRRGRCGRVAPGKVYRLVAHKDYDMFEQEASPEMLRSSLESVILQVKLLDMGSPKSILALAVDPPEECNIKKAACNLKEIGALTILANGQFDAYDGDLTFVGRVISRLPIDIRLGRLVLLGYVFDCLYETVIIAAGLSVKSPFANPYFKRLEAYVQKLHWSGSSFSDCISLVNLYETWTDCHNNHKFSNYADERKWAKTHFVQYNSLREMKTIVEELHRRLKMAGITVQPSFGKPLAEEQAFVLKTVIAGAFYPNYFLRQRPVLKDYQKEISRDLLGQDPFNAVLLPGFPQGQPLKLYEKIIADYLQFQSCVPHLETSGAKVVACFEAHGCNIGRICSAVYRAIKLRQVRDNVTFSIVGRDQIQEYENKGSPTSKLQRRFQCPEQCSLPKLEIRRVQFIIAHTASPSDFYIVLASEIDNLRLISEELLKCNNNLVRLSEAECRVASACIVDLSDQIEGFRRRGRIDAINGKDDILVMLLDEGSSLRVSLSNLFMIEGDTEEPCELFKIPALAIKCQLKGVGKPVRNDYVWSANCIDEFRKFFKNSSSFMIEIFGIWNGVMCGTVFREVEGVLDPKSINEILVDFNYADALEQESAPFSDNYLARERARREIDPTLTSSYFSDLERQKSSLIHETMMDPIQIPKEKQSSTQLITLRGPSNPLEMGFTSMCGSSFLKHVQADGPSVNSVCLDQNPAEPTNRLMVAASVSISHRSGNILARDTTLMPAVPGLTAIMTMLFCPTLEFRIDEEETKYTGCLTGLGTDPSTGYSVYPDHDMEIIFETMVSEEDVAEINSIRAAMSQTLTDQIRQEKLRRIQQDVRERLKRLTSVKRPIVDEVWPPESHEWTNAPKDGVFRGGSQVFPPHEPLLGQPTRKCSRVAEEKSD